MLFSASHSFSCGCLKIAGINDDTIAFLNVDFPGLKPLITNNITDILFGFSDIQIIPLNKISNQFLLNFLFFKDIKKSSVLGKVKIFVGFQYPLINT